MEISQRQMQILSRIVEIYTKSGETIASKMLAEDLGICSSATLRNEMATLEGLGLLKQLHTSSGRVPTYMGYRVYIDSMINMVDLKKVEKSAIKTMMKVSDLNPSSFLDIASTVVAKMTNYTAISTLPSVDGLKIKALEFIMVNNRTIVVTIVFSTAYVTNKVCRLDFAVTSDVLERFCNAVNIEIKKASINDLTPEFIENFLFTLAAYDIVLKPLISVIKDMCTEVMTSDVIVKGRNNLFKFDDINIDSIFNVLSNKNIVYKLLDLKTEDTKVIIGDETCIEGINGSSIITAKYKFGENYKGYIGVIGPMRMDYGKVIPHIEYIASLIGDTLEENIKEN